MRKSTVEINSGCDVNCLFISAASNVDRAKWIARVLVFRNPRERMRYRVHGCFRRAGVCIVTLGMHIESAARVRSAAFRNGRCAAAATELKQTFRKRVAPQHEQQRSCCEPVDTPRNFACVANSHRPANLQTAC